MNRKKTAFILAALIMLSAAAGCTKKEVIAQVPDISQTQTDLPTDGVVETVDPTPSVSPETEQPVTTGDQMVLPAGAQELDEAEIEYFNTEFFNSTMAGGINRKNIRNQFLNSYYDRIEDVCLGQLFYLGTGRYEEIGEAEKAAFERKYGYWIDVCPCEKNRVSDINDVLFENTGLQLEDMYGQGYVDTHYLEEYDAYYQFHGDTNYVLCTIDRGYRLDNCVYLLHGLDGDNPGCVELREIQPGQYHFVSHRQVFFAGQSYFLSEDFNGDGAFEGGSKERMAVLVASEDPITLEVTLEFHGETFPIVVLSTDDEGIVCLDKGGNIVVYCPKYDGMSWSLYAAKYHLNNESRLDFEEWEHSVDWSKADADEEGLKEFYDKTEAMLRNSVIVAKIFDGEAYAALGWQTRSIVVMPDAEERAEAASYYGVS